MRQYARNGLAFLTLYPGWTYFDLPGKGFVAFERHSRVAVVVGDPVCVPGAEAEIVAAFLQFCRREKLTAAFANAREEFLETYRTAGLAMLKIGEEPVFDCATWAPRGDPAKKARSAANQARKAGVTIEVLAPGTTPSFAVAREVEEVICEWRSTRKIHALGFTLRLAPLELAEDKIILLAHHEGRIEAFLTCVPYANGRAYYFEDLIRRKDAPTGASELLVMAAVDECHTRGADIANFGLAPLRRCKEQPVARRVLGRALDFTFRRLNLFYRFKPLEHFKGKFAPTRWEPAYLVYPPGKLVTASVGLLNAFTPGKTGPLTAVTSRFRFHRNHESVWSDILLTAVGGLVSAVAIVTLWGNPDLGLDAALASLSPMEFVGTLARAHLFVDGILALGGAAWFARTRNGSN